MLRLLALALGLRLSIGCIIGERINQDSNVAKRWNFASIHRDQIISPLQLADCNISRIVALGDVHGHFEYFIDLMDKAGICDERGNWIAKNVILIQTGDVFDRRPESFRVLHTIIKWHKIAPSFGSLCLMNMGNHEATHLDPRGLVMPGVDGMHLTEIETFGGIERVRSYWLKTHDFGRFLRHLPVIRVIGSTVFVHAGLSPIVSTEIEGNISVINEKALHYFRDGLQIPDHLKMMEDCYWTRELMNHSDKAEICLFVAHSLDWVERHVGFPVSNMVIGHNTKPTVLSVECEREGHEMKTLWYIDVGLCEGRYGYWEQEIKLLTSTIT